MRFADLVAVLVVDSLVLLLLTASCDYESLVMCSSVRFVVAVVVVVGPERNQFSVHRLAPFIQYPCLT